MQNGEGDNMQTLAGILQELQAQNAGLREQNAAMARAVESQQKALETLLARRSAGVVDVKQVGKPDLLKGSKDEIRREFQNWAYIFESWFSSQFPEAKEILDWAAKHGKTELDLDDAILAISWGKAQKHNGTNAQGFDFIVGRMHGWAYFAILRVFLKKVTKLFWGFWPKIARKTQKRIGCHPIPFRVFFVAEKGRKNRETNWDDTPGEPGVSSQSVSGFSGRKGPEKPENGLGRQAWGAQVRHP